MKERGMQSPYHHSPLHHTHCLIVDTSPASSEAGALISCTTAVNPQPAVDTSPASSEAGWDFTANLHLNALLSRRIIHGSGYGPVGL